MKKQNRCAACILLIFLMAAVFSVSVLADFGPKPKTTLILENPPEGVYYLDLLIPSYDREPYSNLTDKERAGYRADMLAVLEAYRDENGWHPALTVGTSVPLFGVLTGTPDEKGMVHTFSYFGVPDTYKIVVVTEDLQVYTSDVIHKTVFQETLTIRLTDSGTVGVDPSDAPQETDVGTVQVVNTPSRALMYCKQFALTFFPTIVIEFLILLLFRIPVKKNIGVFFGVNLVTQLLLTVIMTRTLMTSGLISAYFILAPLELVILAMEFAAYFLLLRDVKKSRRAGYAVAANFVSAVAGYLLIGVANSFINI